MKKLFFLSLLTVTALCGRCEAQTFAAVPDILGLHLPSYSEHASIQPAYLLIGHMTGNDTIDIGHFKLTSEEDFETPTTYSTKFLISNDLTGACVPVWWAYCVSVGCEEAYELHISNVIIYIGRRQLLEFLPRSEQYLDYMGIDYGWR